MPILALLAGCSGSIGRPPLDAPDGERQPTGDGEEAPPHVVASDDPEMHAGQVRLPAIGHSYLRRLNRFEYNRTVRDLLLTTLSPADAFPIDDIGNGFDNQGQLLSVSPLHAEHYEAAAEKLIDDLYAAAAGSDRRKALLPCDPDVGSVDAAKICVRSTLASFVRRAHRRPADDETLDRLLAFVDIAVSENDKPSMGLRLAMQAVLASPRFLFRVERGSPEEAPRDLDPYELATRLSYLFWSSMPDDQLLAAAGAGLLSNLDGLLPELERLASDAKVDGLVSGFAGQWLHTRRVAGHEVDAKTFPGFDASLRASMMAETERFFGTLLVEERPVSDLLDGDVSFTDARLATHYGVPAPTDAGLVRGPALPDRRGILGQASVLTVTSYSHRTSPVLRGKWVLEQLLCSGPPDPPANVNELEVSSRMVDGPLREVLEHHRSNPSCRPCHESMDEIGLGLESFDAVGRARTRDSDGRAIDDRGALPDGRSFAGAVELAAIIGHDERLAPCVTTRLLTYALGRGLDGTDDEEWVRRMTVNAGSDQASFNAILRAIVSSDLFRKHRPPAAL